MRTNRIKRLLTVVQALESGRSRTVRELAELAGVSRRTVFRDLDLLTQTGIRYTYDRESGRYSADKTTLRPPVSLSYAESLALLLAARQMANGPSLAHREAAASAGLKLESMLPPAIRDYCGPLLDRVAIRRDPASDDQSVAQSLSILQAALTRQRKTAVTYDSYYEGKVLHVVLHPYRLAYIHRGWYLIAFDERPGRVQTYKVERMLHIEMLQTVFTVDPAFNLDAYFGHAWLMIRGDRRYHVKVRFLRKVAANVDEIAWHKSQRTTYEPDGSLIFEADVDGIEEISWWVLGYGDQAQVLEPPELRRLVGERVARMYTYYHGRPCRVSGDGV